jgi:hypothetical protein
MNMKILFQLSKKHLVILIRVAIEKGKGREEKKLGMIAHICIIVRQRSGGT